MLNFQEFLSVFRLSYTQLSSWNLFFNNSDSFCIGHFYPFCISIVKHGFNLELRVFYLGLTAVSFLPAHFLYVFCLLSSVFLLFCHRISLFLLFPRICDHTGAVSSSQALMFVEWCQHTVFYCALFSSLSTARAF